MRLVWATLFLATISTGSAWADSATCTDYTSGAELPADISKWIPAGGILTLCRYPADGPIRLARRSSKLLLSESGLCRFEKEWVDPADGSIRGQETYVTLPVGGICPPPKAEIYTHLYDTLSDETILLAFRTFDRLKSSSGVAPDGKTFVSLRIDTPRLSRIGKTARHPIGLFTLVVQSEYQAPLGHNLTFGIIDGELRLLDYSRWIS